MAVQASCTHRINEHRGTGIRRAAHDVTRTVRIANQDPIEDSRDGVDMEDMEQIVFRMREKESTIYHNNCKERGDIANDELVTLWRRMLVDWMYYVVDCCDLQRHSVGVAAYFLDVAMLRDLCRSREEHQLAAATSLQMALKTFDTAVIKLDKLVKLGRGLFTENDVTVMEMKIITSLNWHLHPPTAYCFLRQYERLIPTGITDSTKKMIDNVTNLIAEEFILDKRYIRFPPSIQGYSAMLVAIDLIPDDAFPDNLRNSFAMRMSTVAKLDSNSVLISKVTNKIYRTLTRSDKLQKLMDIRMSKTKNINICDRVLNNIEKHPKKTRDGTNGVQHHSPRDVKQRV